MKILSFNFRVEQNDTIPVVYNAHVPFLELGEREIENIGLMFKRAFREINLKTGPINLNDLKVGIAIENKG